MSLLQIIISKLWYGPLWRYFRAIVSHLINTDSRILLGPMRGLRFNGRIHEILGIHEVHIQDVIYDNLREGDVFYDVGAFYGYFSLLGVKRVAAKGYVYAFEPFPSSADRIQRIMSANQVVNYMVIPKAVSNISGNAKLYHVEGEEAEASLIETERSQRLNVCTTTLDEFANSHRWPDLVKIDIEGAEELALEGASKILASRSAPAWITELHSREIAQLVKELFSSYGYHICDLGHPYGKRKQYPCHILARKPGSK